MAAVISARGRDSVEILSYRGVCMHQHRLGLGEIHSMALATFGRPCSKREPFNLVPLSCLSKKKHHGAMLMHRLSAEWYLYPGYLAMASSVSVVYQRGVLGEAGLPSALKRVYDRSP